MVLKVKQLFYWVNFTEETVIIFKCKCCFNTDTEYGLPYTFFHAKTKHKTSSEIQTTIIIFSFKILIFIFKYTLQFAYVYFLIRILQLPNYHVL